MRLTKSEAISKIYNCAVLYQKNLMGKNVLFIGANENKATGFEAIFLPRNFQHFTGVGTNLKSSTLFFNAAVNNELSEKDIIITTDGTTELKLEVLPTLMNIHVTARMFGDYDNSKSLLVTDKLAGTQTAAMGFVEDKNYFYPNTVLNDDLRNLTIKPRQRVIAIFVKNQKDKIYNQLTYIPKGMTIDDKILQTILKQKVDIDNIEASFIIPRLKETTV